MGMEVGRRTPVQPLRELCSALFLKSGLPQDDVDVMTDTLVRAEVRGVSSHGVIRAPFYCKRLLDKGSNPNPHLKLVTDLPSLMLVDGDNGLGQIISARTMKLAIERAKHNGICFAGVNNSCHFGLASYYPMLASDEGLIGIAGSNCPPVMAVWGGSQSAIGNNPLAISVPTGKGYPLVLDIAMSVVSGGKVRLEAVKGSTIPLDWILNAQGRRTTNPNDLGDTGTLLPLGHKGSGLAIMIEVLASILTNSAMLSEIGLWFRDTSMPINNGHFIMAINIEALLPLEVFKNRVDQMIDELKSTPPMEGSAGVYMPGEMEYLTEKACARDGVPLSPEVLQSLNDFALKLGVPGLTIESVESR
jgi:LDH2 family malate/lactate/ureidoglycolate dehydrogenase